MTVHRPLFKPTYRLIGYCLFIGACGGFAALAFDWMVHVAQHYFLTGIGHYAPPEPGNAEPVVQILGTIKERWWIPVALTLGGLLSGFIVFKWAPEAEGHGTDAAVGAYHEGGQIRARIPFIKAVASALTIGSGGVAGKEGPTAQISVGIGSILGRLLGLRGSERRALLLAGMAAGLAAIFRAPLGMAIFSVEILYSEMVFESESLIYTVIAAVTAYAVHGMFAGWDHIFFIPSGITFDKPLTLVSFAVLGLAAGLLGAVLPSLFYKTRDLFLKLPGPPHIKPAIGALMVGIAGMFVPEILGTGYGWVQLALVGKLSIVSILLILLLKAPGLAATIGSGGSGGVFAPSVAIGAMLGAGVGAMMNSLLPSSHLPIAAFVVVGMASVFAGAARTPISTLIMVAEMTGGYGLIVPAMLSNILSFMVQHSLTNGVQYPTLYESQVARREDSPTHRGVFVRRAVEILDHEALEGADLTMPRLASLLRFGEPIPVQDDKWRLVTVRIEPGSAFAGHTVAETVGGISGTTAVAVLRGDEMLIARGPTRLEAGDDLLAVTTPESHEFLQAFAQGTGGDEPVLPPPLPE